MQIGAQIVPVKMGAEQIALLDLLAKQGPGETRSAQVRAAVWLLGDERQRQLTVLSAAGDARAAQLLRQLQPLLAAREMEP